jgi:hypothetical protein
MRDALFRHELHSSLGDQCWRINKIYKDIYIYIYNIYKTRSLNINAHKAGLCIDQLTVHSQEPKPVFPLGAMGSVFANSVFMVNL